MSFSEIRKFLKKMQQDEDLKNKVSKNLSWAQAMVDKKDYIISTKDDRILIVPISESSSSLIRSTALSTERLS